MQFIEISNENGDILYRGTNVRSDDTSYIFEDILTDSEIVVPKEDVYCVSNLTYSGYQNTLKYLTLIKNDDQLTQGEKKHLFKLQRVYKQYTDLKCLKLLNLGKYTILDDVPIKVLQKSLARLISVELKKATTTLDKLISAENDETVILEINSTKSDLENNVKDFLEAPCFPKTIEGILQKWPTLLNPSPFQQILTM